MEAVMQRPRWRTLGQPAENYPKKKETSVFANANVVSFTIFPDLQGFLFLEIFCFALLTFCLLLKSAELLSYWKFETIPVFADLSISEFKLNIIQWK